jgi:hypothetical protein
MHNFTQGDIAEYTSSRLNLSLHGGAGSSSMSTLISELTDQVVSRALGVFIWVRIVVDDLSQHIVDGTPFAKLKAIVSHYPPELDDLYKLTMERIKPKYALEAWTAMNPTLLICPAEFGGALRGNDCLLDWRAE